ncbi:VOC family protein [Galbibacter pacificus]|uniref:VOC family protein n=1 Tax=Galbibacter pacificus TaxID=2996052 RepID=A0ABT6FUM3_9FLAO|nr:VOC family protein [Galbibacter pacificus]MDG3583556.1 VOC family protein [Galbibacter pacificus]MDG3586968.1 VOC family protein [Galbibacter pacificus]
MKTTLSIIAIATSMWLQAQIATEVYLFDMDKSFRLTNPVNLSNNPGFYDNQPSFIDNNLLLYTSTRNHQTDIKEVDLRKKTQQWVTNTPGNEFSPQATPKTNIYAAIRLDNDGKQRLYNYSSLNGGYEELISDQTIGYYSWYDKNTIVSFVPEEDNSKLVVNNLKNQTNFTFKENIGRSICKIPNTNLVSYIDKSSDVWEIRSFDPISGTDAFIANTLEGSEDMAWGQDGTILMGKEEVLYKYNPKGDQKWIPVSSLEYFNLKGITRLAISPNGKQIAIVVNEEIPESIQQQNNAIIDIGIVVTNLKKSLAFYKDILGMKETRKFTIDKAFGRKSGLTSGLSAEVTVLQLAEGNNATELKLMSFGKHKNWYPDYIQQDMGVQYITIYVKSVAPYLKRIQENNIKLLGDTPIAFENGESFLLIKDYDGTFIEIIGATDE